MRIPNNSAFLPALGGQSAKEAVDKNKSIGSASEAAESRDANGPLEQLNEGDKTGDRDAREQYDGRRQNSTAETIESTKIEDANHELLGLEVSDPSAPSSLDLKA